ncbi:uncharacterized protein [Blastocystis hominis]|uniref:Uncharacterized protein n=1 Tax=Blastocystis hominis TaxID=12968 RepID=D8M5Y9_BLAHO|nr:uncharacterized protein [Blastocystis hominis]CBK23588.2 unnamed protein product [Blastocystis hominis]|eukprot:XP_012897636.1 uncharacterized protein [Blastocystis hominis]
MKKLFEAISRWYARANKATLNVWIFAGAIVGMYTMYEASQGLLHRKVKDRWSAVEYEREHPDEADDDWLDDDDDDDDMKH